MGACTLNPRIAFEHAFEIIKPGDVAQTSV